MCEGEALDGAIDYFDLPTAESSTSLSNLYNTA